MTTAYITHPRCSDHTLPQHPEHAGRIRAIWQRLDESGLAARMRSLQPEPASTDDILMVHTQHYLDNLKWVASNYQEMVLLNPDTYFGPQSLEIAQLAAGGALLGVNEVLTNQADNALVVVRPPGHHAMPDNAMGFCLLGNVAMAVRYAQKRHQLERVMIVDYDVHHGNGTQDMLYDDPHSLFVSTHQYPFYPGSGAVHETGSGAGQGYTANIPLQAGHDDHSYATLFRDIIWPLADRYQPQLLVVSAGFDAHWNDPLANMHLSLNGYAHITHELIQMARAHCDGKIVVVLEGGYNLDVLAHGVQNIAHALLGDDDISDPIGPGPQRTAPVIGPLIAEVKHIHKL